MTILSNDMAKMVFKRSARVKLSEYSNDIKTFNVLFALDGKRSVRAIAEQDSFDPVELAAKVKELYDQGMIEPAAPDSVSRGRARKLLDAIILKRTKGFGFIVKTIRLKIALIGTNPDTLTPDTPDDPVLLKKLTDLARSYGLQVQTKPQPTMGRTKLILETIITQRSGGDPMLARAIKTKLMLKGINPDAYSLNTPDDQNLVKRLVELAAKLGVKIPSAQAGFGHQIEQML